MKMKIYVYILMSLMVFNSYGKKNDKVQLKEEAVPISTVNGIQGFFGDRININREVYLKKFPIDEYVDFIVKREHTSWGWTKAEQHGKWVESAYLSALQSNDKELLDKAKKVLNRIIASQEPSGYVGATAKSYRNENRPVRGMDAYELYFVFHAFMTVYEQTGNKEALTSAENLADYFIKYFGPGKLEFWPSKLRYPDNMYKEVDDLSEFAGHGVHYSWEGTLLCDPSARLYELTGKKEYLDWSKWIVNNIDKWSGWNAFSRLDSVADGLIGVDKLQPYVHSHTFQMNFMGFLRLYRITGDTSLLRKVEGAWNDIAKRQMYITGGVSVAEHYEHDYVKPLSGHAVETCATMSWIQLTQMLLELTGNAKYADAMEKLMINHVFAAQDCETGSCRYHTAPNGDKPSGNRGYFHGPDCCTASGHRIISMFPTFFYAERGKNFYVNQYFSSRYEGNLFAFELKGDFPESGNISIVIEKGKGLEKTINLRLPKWCNKPSVSVNGKAIVVDSEDYLKITRKWNKGDKIDIVFPMEERWIMREHHSKYTTYTLPKGEIMYKEEPTDRIPYTLMRGPVVYCVDMVWNKQLNNDDASMEKDIRVDVESKPVIVNKPYNKILGPVYKAKGTYKGTETDIIMTPFVNIGQWFRPGEEKPQHDADAFTYAIWLYKNGVK